MILVLDNYDSFTWNLVHYLRELGAEVEVVRNDALSVDEAMGSGAEGFLVSPGPGRPEEAGISLSLVNACAAAARPLLGICLGHQAVGVQFGAQVARADPMHGKTDPIRHDRAGLFSGLPSPFTATRYHSLVLAPETVGSELEITAFGSDGTIQGVRHRTLPLFGVQFHPESIASQFGHRLLRNFVVMVEEAARSSSRH